MTVKTFSSGAALTIKIATLFQKKIEPITVDPKQYDEEVTTFIKKINTAHENTSENKTLFN